MNARMRAYDWAATPLGRPENWPQSLKTVVRIMLTSRFAMWMAWGPELIFFCNDAYLPTTGVKQDWVLGARSDRVWAEIWSDIGPRIQHVLATGEATWDEQLLLYLERSGFTEETYHTFSYSPLADESGANVGMLCVVAEVTDRVIGDRQLATLRDLGTQLATASTSAEVMSAFDNSLKTAEVDLPFVLIYQNDHDTGRAVRATVNGIGIDHFYAPAEIDLVDQQAPWPFADALKSGVTSMVHVMAPDTGQISTQAQTPPECALILPISGAEGAAPFGFLVAGLNPHRSLDAEYRGFVEILTGQIAAAIARADEYERERARAEALAQLDHAKTAFFSNVSHEFRTPLTLMLAPLEDVLADRSNLPTAQLKRIEIAHRNGLRLLRLVNTLLDFSRLEAGRAEAHYQPLDLGSLTSELASTFRSVCERAGLAFDVASISFVEPVYVDRDMWEKIVLNLLSNAFKFTLEGGISVRLTAAKACAILEIEDTGVGIPEAELPKLFERFHRIEGSRGRSIEGSGIGLALVQELVHLHGGTISVESKEESGSTFRIEIPLGSAHLPADRIKTGRPAQSTALQAQIFVDETLRWLQETPVSTHEIIPDIGGAAHRSAGGRVGRVLLADDNADLRDYVRHLLETAGYQVETAVDGEAALEAARRERPDLLLTDIMMPRMDGFTLLTAIRADPGLIDLPVVMLSARAGEEAQVEGLEAGADDYLAKPFSARELLARVSANLDMARLRRQTTEALRVSEAQLAIERGFLASVLAKAPVGIATIDRHGHFVDINERGIELLGYHPQQQEIGDFIREGALHQDGRPYTREEYPTIRALKGERVDGERMIYLRGAKLPQERLVLSIDAAPIFDPAGELIGAVSVFEDANIRDRAEEELKRRVEERTRERDRTWNNSQDLLLVLDRQGIIQAVNPAWTAILGWRVEELVGRSYLDFITEDDQDSSLAALNTASREVLRGFQNHYQHKAGSHRLISWIATPDGELIYATGRDITAEREAAKALQEAQARLRSIFETTYQFQGFLTPGGVMMDANPASLAAIRRPYHEVVGRRFWDTPWFTETPGMPEQIKAAVALVATGQAFQQEITINLPSGARSFDFSMRPVIDSARQVIGIVPEAMDLTDQRQTEEALRQAQKMEAVGQLTGGIAHDFNNMLAVVIGSLDLLGRRIDNADPRMRRYVDAASDGARRAALLTQRLLAFSRQQALKPVTLDANKLVAGMSDLLRHSLGSDIRLETVLGGGLWRTHADPNQLESVILNLAVNARDAMPEGGRLTIETQNAHLDDRYVAGHLGIAAGQYVLIAISDTGIGMLPEIMAKAFDPFFTTKEVGKGTGLGLSQVYGFVKQSGGHVKIYSELGEGTVVKIYLPRQRAPLEEKPDTRETVNIPLGERQELILVVEDEPSVRQFTIDALGELGYQVLEADGAAMALRLLVAHPEISLMFTDVVMPDVNGRKLAAEARLVRPDLKVLFTTGYTRNAVVHNGVLDAGVELITKPFTIEDLAAKVRNLLDAIAPPES